ncbi:MAG TPA: YCF48-related protein [Rhodothermales bacterium]|nr:YCF48-related protein [Rhodothermales bacterium]
MLAHVKQLLRIGLFVTLFLMCSGVVFGQGFENISWRQTNGPEGGRATAFFEHDGDLLVGTSRGGIFRSTDEGQSWEYVGLAFVAEVTGIVESLAGTLIAGTYGDGIYRSTDGGTTWAVVEETIQPPPGQLNPLITATIAVDSHGWILSGSRVGLFRSKDDGLSWEFIQPDEYFPGVYIDTIKPAPSGQLFMLALGTIYLYDEDRDTWIDIGSNAGDFRLALAVLDSTTILAGSYNLETDTKGLLRSTDSGQTWEMTALEEITYFIDIDETGRIFAGTDNGVYRSLDQGETWEQLALPQVTMIGTYGEDNVIVGLYGDAGLLQSEDAGETWHEKNTGFANSMVFSTAIDAQGRIFAGTERGVFRSTDAGVTWEHYGLDESVSELLITPAGNLFARSHGNHLYRSSPETINWQVIETVSVQRFEGRHRLAMGPDGHLFDLEGTMLWRSADEGETWQSIEVPLAISLMIHPNGDIFLGSYSKGVYRSSDEGQTWEQLTNGLKKINDPEEMPEISTLVVDEAGRIFAGTYGNDIYRSVDGGDSWQSVAEGDVKFRAGSLVIWNGKLFVGSGLDGVFVTEDGGDTWIPLNTNLENPWILSLSVDKDGYLVAGTFGNGVWRTEVPINVSIEEQLPETFSDGPDLQGYPNPFHNGATLAFTLSAPAPVRLSVHDILGREVAVLLDEQKASGYHTTSFDADGLPNGVYFVTLSTSQGTYREQLLLVK